MIYFVQGLDGGPIKIGCSDDVERRRSQLETNYGQPLTVLATLDGDVDEEAAIHAQFSHLRLGRTEQFLPDDELMAFIGRPASAALNLAAVEPMTNRVKSLASLKGSEQYRAWLEGLAEHAHLPMAILIEHALREYAENHGYEAPQPRR